MLRELADIPARVLIFVAVILLGIVGALVVLYVATPGPEKPNPWQMIGGAGVAVGVSLPSLLAWIRSNMLHSQVAEQSQAIGRVEAQTNGALDARIATQVRAALYDATGNPAAFGAPLAHPAPPDPTPSPQEAPA